MFEQNSFLIPKGSRICEGGLPLETSQKRLARESKSVMEDEAEKRLGEYLTTRTEIEHIRQRRLRESQHDREERTLKIAEWCVSTRSC